MYNVQCTVHRVSTDRVAHGTELINPGDKHPLCTLHPAEGLYSWVRHRGYSYMRDSLYKSLSGICTPATQAGRYTRGPLYPYSLMHGTYSVQCTVYSVNSTYVFQLFFLPRYVGASMFCCYYLLLLA